MLHDIALFLAAAVIAVPLSRALGLGSVLGYLIAGLAIGPWGLGLITEVENILDFSEFGVVLLLFVIGLELQPTRLWQLRGPVFGAGAAQVVISSLALALAGLALGLPAAAAIVAGFALAMSSTAFVLQMLGERNELATREGSLAFAILLFQDLAAIPFIALVPLLGVDAAATEHGAGEMALRAFGIVAGVIAAGRYLLRPVLRALARTSVPEIFTAAALLVVVGTALLMETAELSMSLGAFLAGVLLAESEFRHELQASIEPFKGLLLGLFFMAVGMSVNLGLLASEPVTILGLVIGLVAVKAAVLFGIGRFNGLSNDSARALAAAVPQGGEFAFVMFGLAAAAGLLSHELAERFTVVVALSMAIAPPLYLLQARFRAPVVGPAFDAIDTPPAPVIVAGFGPFGQIVGRLLRVKKIPFTVLEKDMQQVDVVRRFGNKIYYGDAAKPELLRAAHAASARALVIAISRPETSLAIAETARRNFPNLRVFAVANDRNHALRLMDLGVRDVIRRAYFSSLEMARQLLVTLGEPPESAQRAVETFRSHDEATLRKQQAIYRDETQLIQNSRDAARELEQLFEADRPAPASPPAPLPPEAPRT